MQILTLSSHFRCSALLVLSLFFTTIQGQSSYFEKALFLAKENCDEDAARLLKTGFVQSNRDWSATNGQLKALWHAKDYEGTRAVCSVLLTQEVIVPMEDATLADITGWRGKALWELGRYRAAKLDLAKSVDVVIALKGKDHPDLIELYGFLGAAHYRDFDAEAAPAFYLEAIRLHKLHDAGNSAQLVKLYRELSSAYRRKGDEEKAIEYVQYAIAQQKSIDNSDIAALDSLKLHLGYVLTSFERYEEAEKIALGLMSHIEGPLSAKFAASQKGGIYLLAGECAYQRGDYKKAVVHYERALAFAHPRDRRSALSALGACHTNLKNFLKASMYMDSVILLHEVDPHSPNWTTSEEISKNTVIIFYFKAKVHLQQYLHSGDVRQLYTAHEWYDRSIQAIDYMSKGFSDAQSRQRFLDLFYYVFEKIIETNYQLYLQSQDQHYAERAFYYMEKSKSILLKDALQTEKANALAVVPASLTDTIQHLQRRLAEAETVLYRQQKGGNSLRVDSLNTQILQLNRRKTKLMKQLESQYPEYYRLKYRSDTISVADIRQTLLRPGETLLQYFVGDDNIYSFVANADTVALAKAPKGPAFDESVRDLRSAIYGYPWERSDSMVTAYTSAAHHFYQLLIAPVKPALTHRLLIVPDGLLEYIPFDALLTEPVPPGLQAFGRLPYLIKEASIHYGYSALLARALRQREGRAELRRVLALAPSFPEESLAVRSADDRRRSLGALAHNTQEVSQIARLFASDVLAGSAASKRAFVERAGRYQVLHLATHAKADDELGAFSYLAFAPVAGAPVGSSQLSIKDIHLLRLSADLVVLSACETGVGELRRGEGVVSLARAFSQAGASSLLASLWRVSDRETADLMASFYGHLAEGQPIDESLRQAKLSFLHSEGVHRGHPFFWAAFLPTGKMEGVDLPAPVRWGWWVLGLLGMLALGYVWHSRRRALGGGPS